MLKQVHQSRRGFLKAGGATAAGIAILGLAGVAAPGGEHYGAFLEGESPTALSNKEFAVLTAASETLIGQAGDLPSVRDTRTSARIDRELSIVQGRLLTDVKASLLYIEYAPMLAGFGSRFTCMASSERTAYMERLSHTDDALERSIFFGLRFLTIFFFYSDNRTWNHLGYGGPLVDAKFYPAGNRIENLEGLT